MRRAFVPRQVPCPRCERGTWFVPAADAYFHADGTDNRACWIAVVRGEVAYPGDTRLREVRAGHPASAVDLLPVA